MKEYKKALGPSAESEVGDVEATRGVEVRVAPGPSVVSGVLGGAKKDGTKLPISGQEILTTGEGTSSYEETRGMERTRARTDKDTRTSSRHADKSQIQPSSPGCISTRSRTLSRSERRRKA